MDGSSSPAAPDVAELLDLWRAATRETERARDALRRADRAGAVVVEAERAALEAQAAAAEARFASDRARAGATEAHRAAAAARAFLASEGEHDTMAELAVAEQAERLAKDAYHEAQERLFADLQPSHEITSYGNGVSSARA